MKLKESFATLADRLPIHGRDKGDSAPEPYEPGPPLTADELLPPLLETNDPRLLLADSIEQLNNPLASSAQLEAVREVVIEDAENLAANLLPPQVAEALELKPSHELEDTTPTLAAIFLLAEASDATGDEKLMGAIDYLLTASPPHHSRELWEAFLAARKNHTPIMQEFIFIRAEGDVKNDTAKDPKAREAALSARRETPPQNQHFYRTSGHNDTERTMT